jgi:hypothetical protein
MRDQNQKKPPHHHDPPPGNHDDYTCKENDTATQKLINTERKVYCSELDTAAGAVYQWEENYLGWKDLKKKKRCLFVWTEKNYQAFRNLQITKGISLNQFNEGIKASTTTFLKANKTVSDGLKDIVKKLKEVQTKIGELRTAACDLKHCAHEGCNCTQWGILTGDWTDTCKGTRPEVKRPPECDHIKEKFEKLFCIPKALYKDAEHSLKASADVVGIQVFSNISSLESLQKTLSENATKFDKYLQETVKKDQEDLKKITEDFSKTMLEVAKSKTTLYGKRTEFEGLLETTGFFCCPKCGCVQPNDNCEERLKECKEKICDICGDVKDTFCKEPEPAEQGAQAY